MFTLRFAGGTKLTSLPSRMMRPAVGSSNPAIMRSVVVLPQPLGPSIEKNSPPGISNVTSSTATVSPNFLVTRSILISPCAGVSFICSPRDRSQLSRAG